MTGSELRDLLVAAASVLRHKDRFLMADHGHTVIDDVPVQLQHKPEHDPRRLVLAFDLGELPREDAMVALIGLMHLNLISGSKTTGVFAYDALADRVRYVVHLFDPHHSAPMAFVQALRDHARRARAGMALALAAAHSEMPQAAAPQPAFEQQQTLRA